MTPNAPRDPWARFTDLSAAALRTRFMRTAAKGAWRAHLAVPGSDADVAAAARRFAGVFAAEGHHADAGWVLDQAARKAGEPVATGLRAAAAAAQLDSGRIPTGSGEIVGCCFEQADALMAAGDLEGCVDLITDALTVHFHPQQHFGVKASPLMTETGDFVRHWAAEGVANHPSVAALLADPAPLPRETVDASKVLVVGQGNLSFIGPLVAEYRARGFAVRELDLSTALDNPEALSLRQLTADRLRYGLTGKRIPVPAAVRDAFEWAEVIVVEWGHRALVWTSLLEGVRAPIVTRLDKYEVYTPMPLLTVWSSVAHAVVPSPIIQDVLIASVPGFDRAATTVLAPRMVLEPYSRPKLPEASRTMAVVGWNKINKDPAWALAVLRKVREIDPTWRLLLVGSTELAEEGTMTYYEGLTGSIVSLKDAVEVTGFTADVAATLRRVGVIISASQSEGMHEALVQGVASGALPVVRNWPLVREWGGPARLFPASWVVDDVDAAAERILAYAVPHHSEDARAAQEWVMNEVDWQVIQPQFDAVMLHRRPDSDVRAG